MEKRIIQFTIAFGALAAAFVGIWLFTSNRQHTSDRQPKCDSAETVATIKNMALAKFNSMEGFYLVPNRGITLSDGGKTASYYSGKFSPENLTIDSFRKRGVIGEAGSSCAALIVTHVAGDKFGMDKISVEYLIEPTTDGMTMITARYQRN